MEKIKEYDEDAAVTDLVACIKYGFHFVEHMVLITCDLP